MIDIMDFEDLEEVVGDAGGLAAVTMDDLCGAAGVKELEPEALHKIKQGLGRHGMGSFPELTLDRRQQVRVYQKGKAVGELIDAVLSPSDSGDTLLRERSDSSPWRKLSEIEKIIFD